MHGDLAPPVAGRHSRELEEAKGEKGVLSYGNPALLALSVLGCSSDTTDVLSEAPKSKRT